MQVGDIVRVVPEKGRVTFYEVLGVFLGTEKQISLVEIWPLTHDRQEAMRSPIMVPIEFFDGHRIYRRTTE